MDCSKCGAENRENDKFCSKCGAQLSMKSESDTQSFAPVFEEEPSPVDVSPQDETVLVVAKGPAVGQRFILKSGEVTLGRDPASDIFLDDFTVSRKHAKIVLGADRANLVDDGSLNGTYVNGTRIDRAVLKSGDELQVGKFKLVYLAGRH
ncbi:MAG: FHA domain-containing protein [Terriglobia bacterium]